MLYYSTNGQAAKVSFKDAALKGLAEDKGLYFPEKIPHLPKDFIENLDEWSKEEIAFQVIAPYVSDSIPAEVLKQIVSETISFPFPLESISDNISTLELFHGPTLAFKDVGARFMSRCLHYFLKEKDQKVVVLVATSGDTGGAVAHGFYNVPGIDVLVLYPSGKVSSIQELQLTTMGNNICALEVEGTFDDCQRMVKEAFADKALNEQFFLTSANSINVARWLPQQFYYFFAHQQWNLKGEAPVVCVPSGNFGNICAGLLAYKSGLPVRHFIAACNCNDIVSHYLQNEIYTPKKAVPTLSNAMDVGDPSNFVRILQLFDRQHTTLKNILSSYTVSDDDTAKTMQQVYQQYGYVLDPHGAVAYNALQHWLSVNGGSGYFLETAHPVKFYDAVEPLIGAKVPMPEAVKSLTGKQKKSINISNDYNDLKKVLQQLG